VIVAHHKLVLDLPPDTPTGPLEIRLAVSPTETEQIVDEAEAIEKWRQERERIRTRLAAAGFLSTVNYDIADNLVRPSEEEIWSAGTLPPGSPTSQEILRELRDDS
jgi:hypothetical protein